MIVGWGFKDLCAAVNNLRLPPSDTCYPRIAGNCAQDALDRCLFIYRDQHVPVHIGISILDIPGRARIFLGVLGYFRVRGPAVAQLTSSSAPPESSSTTSRYRLA